VSEDFQYAQPVFEHEETDGDCQASVMECPCCGSRQIVFVGSSRWTGTSIEITMTCESRHRWDFVLAQQDGEMVARCKTYPEGEGIENNYGDNER
jgi:hypothetical protein